MTDIDRRDFIHTSVAVTAAVVLARSLSFKLPMVGSREAVLAQIPIQHDQTVRMLREWIALPSIAAENLGFPQGAEYMAKLAREAGFQHVEVVPTSGKPGVFATLDAGATTWVGLYFMYDVK